MQGNTQFLLRDVPPLRKYPKTSRHYWFTYQSGLFTSSGKPKPSALAYLFPFLAQPALPLTANLWGQLRFRPNDLPEGAQDQVQIQFKPADGRLIGHRSEARSQSPTARASSPAR